MFKHGDRVRITRFHREDAFHGDTHLIGEEMTIDSDRIEEIIPGYLACETRDSEGNWYSFLAVKLEKVEEEEGCQ